MTTKSEISILDGTPSKRMFWSIISDYDLNTGLCELIDNAIDTWNATNTGEELRIDIELDTQRQLVSISDNAGGVSLEDLALLISPGGSKNDPNSETIGIFGVGSKRAVVAIAESISIKTRNSTSTTHQVDIDNNWLDSEGWEIPAYEVSPISPGTTSIAMTMLRRKLDDEHVKALKKHLGEVYGEYLSRNKLHININNEPIDSISFEYWSFPPSDPPKEIVFEVRLNDGRSVTIDMTAGLRLDRDSDTENYGVYFYCNRRLVSKEIKTRDVGYISGEAGVPHPDASLCRVIIKMQGPAQLMPWNSSKTGINYSHQIFLELRPILLKLVSHFSTLSRRLKNEWPSRVFAYPSGEIEVSFVDDPVQAKRLHLPPLPKVKHQRYDVLKTQNAQVLIDSPWTLGLVEAVSAVDLLEKQRLDTKNRIALILLDSSFEIALKEFIVHREDIFPKSIYNDAKIKSLFANRRDVINAVVAKHPIDPAVLKRVSHYYELRNKLIHERASASITSADVRNYRQAVESVLSNLFGLSF